MAHPTNVLQIAIGSRVGHPENQQINLQKVKKTREENEGENIMDLGSILVPFWKAFLGGKMRQKKSDLLDAFGGQKRGGPDCFGSAGRNAQGQWRG